jgi:hypothetical protein
MHHHRIQWATFMHINMLMSPCLIWVSSDRHTAVKLAFLHGELMKNTFVKPLQAPAAPKPSFRHLNKMLGVLRLAKMALDIGIDAVPFMSH